MLGVYFWGSGSTGVGGTAWRVSGVERGSCASGVRVRVSCGGGARLWEARAGCVCGGVFGGVGERGVCVVWGV